MLGNKKGNVVIASVILSVALCVCTVAMIYSLKRFKNSIIYYAEVQKGDVIGRLRYQKNELKQFVRNREARLRNFVRKELKGATLEVKTPGN